MGRHFIPTLLFILALSSCYKGKLDPSWKDHTRAEFEEKNLVRHMTPEDIMKVMGKRGEIDSLQFDTKLIYDVDVYKYSYYTCYEQEDNIVKAEGLLLIPCEVPSTHFCGYMHGTVFPEKTLTDTFGIGTPSEFDGYRGCQDVRECALAVASAGYTIAIPDYTGFGPTASLDHPFIYYPELQRSAVDGLLSARSHLEQMGLNPGKDIWLSGWSQGAGMAMYMQRMLENDPKYKNLFNVRCNSLLAGPFDVYNFLLDLLKKPDEPVIMMALYSWAGYSINRFCPTLQRPLDQVFRTKIYDQLDAILIVGVSPKTLFTDFFMKNIMNGKDEKFIAALKDCSTCEGWDPVAPIHMHHGTKDDIVTSINSLRAYEGLRNRAKNGIKLSMYEGESHMTFVPTFASKTIDDFQAQNK